MNYPILIFFGLAPSIIWLMFFLREDKLPESNRMILKIFFFGMLATIPVALIELGFSQQIANWNLPPLLLQIIYAFLGIALVEELAKYLIVKKKVLSNPEFDEPIDVVLYMIVSALGFAALENIFLFLPLNNFQPFFFETVISTFVLRLVSATFLHALVSALIGYHMALAFCQPKKRFKFLLRGIVLAVGLHGLYDFSIMSIEKGYEFIIPAIIIISLIVFFVFFGFKRINALKSVCHPKKIK